MNNMNGLIDVIVKVISIFSSMFIALVLFSVFSYVGWLKVAIAFALILIITFILIYYKSKKTQQTLDDERYNERISKLNQELSRPIIQSVLAKQANEPIDLGQIIKGKATFTDKNGNTQDLDISVNLKIK